MSIDRKVGYVSLSEQDMKMYSDPWDDDKGTFWFVHTLEMRDGSKVSARNVPDFIGALRLMYGIVPAKKDNVDVYTHDQRTAIRKLIDMRL